MKEVLAILFPYLVLLYLFDCVARVPYGHMIFVSHFGPRFRLKRDGIQAVGLLPTGLAVHSHDLPLFLSGAGIHLPAVETRRDRPPRARDLRFVPWGEIVSAASEGPYLVINGDVAATLPSAAAAAETAAAVREISESPPASRRTKAEAIVAASFDLRGVEGVRERLGKPLIGVTIVSTLLFLCVYAVLPLALFARPFQGRSIVPLVLAMALAYVLTVAAAFAARKAVAPEDAPGRTHLLLLLVLLPPGAAHVLAPLTRDLFARYDHLAVAAALLHRDDFRRLARTELARLAFAEIPPGDGDLSDSLRMRERAVRGLLAQAGLDADRILAPPPKEIPEAERYCPACEVEYLGGADRCADCGIPLAGFGGSSEPATGGSSQESACANASPG